MKPNHLFTSLLALATVVATSCSAPRVAQQSTNDDDVYNTTAKAKIYTPAPIKPSQQTPSETIDDQEYAESDYYGTSDPYYDMDYSSRINRFYYSSPWRNYYDPYFYSGWYPSYSIGLGYSPFYNSFWNSPYSGWGYAYSPFWGYNNYGWNNYYGGGYYGGGFLGGGYYGGGFYTGRTTNVPDYRSRPSVGRENGVGSYRNGYGRTASGVTRSDANGNVVSRQRRAEAYDANGSNSSAPARTSNTRPARSQTESARPARTENTAPARQPESRPSYTPPARSDGGSSGGGSRGSSSGSSGGGSRPTRAGRG